MKPASEPIEIEPALVADEGEIRTLLQQAELPEEDFAAHLAQFVVARQGGRVIGVAGFERRGPDALLRSLAVAPARRGQGLGDRLVRHLADAAGRKGVQRFYLLTTTAEPFFVRHRFQPVSREQVPAAIAATPEFQRLCPASAVCLTRTVRP